MTTADQIPVFCAFTKIVKTTSLKPHPKNPNRHPQAQIEIFAKVVKALGWRAPIVVSSRSGLITKGHGKLAVAQFLGLQEVPIDLQGYASEAEEIQDLLADNRISELSERNDVEVAALLQQLEEQGTDTIATGYDQASMDKILNRLADAHGDDDAGADEISIADKLQAKYGVKVGQLWRLGEHRIFCGSCTEAASWKVLMGTDRGQLVHTDPPYGVDYEDAAGQTIKNDKLKQDALAKLIRQGLGHAVHFTHPDAAFYVWHAWAIRRDFEFAFDQVGLMERQYITWVKDSFNLGRADYHWQTEPCFYAEKAGQRAKWYGDRAQGTVWRIRALPSDGTAIAIASGILLTDGEQAQLYIKAEKPKAAKARHLRVLPDHPAVLADRATSTAWEISRDARKDYAHPNQKPTGLARIAIQNSSKEGDIVIDQFSGSGSTLIACEMTGRRARAMDLEPKWVAVAIERWSKATNQQPEIIQ